MHHAHATNHTARHQALEATGFHNAFPVGQSLAVPNKPQPDIVQESIRHCRIVTESGSEILLDTPDAHSTWASVPNS